MNVKNKHYINWKSYWDINQVNEYNLRNTKNVKLFYTNDLLMNGNYQLNYLNKYWGELPMMYYIWKNNLKSDYICISQYRRDITYIDFDELDKGKIQDICEWTDEGITIEDSIKLFSENMSKHVEQTIWNFIKKHFKLNDSQLNIIKSRKRFKRFAIFVWAMNWDTYCKLCEFIFGLINAFFPNESWKNINKLNKYMETEKKLYSEKDIYFYDDRFFAHLIEDILSIILSQFFDLFISHKYFIDTYIYTEVTKNNTLDDISKFYKLNLKTNPYFIFVKCLDDQKYKEFYDFFTANNWTFQKLKIINKNEKINLNENHIKLNINEYIDLDEPIDLWNNKYEIKTYNLLNNENNINNISAR